jgi:hypothetical protein
MNRTNVLIIVCLAVIFVGILACPITIRAQAQQNNYKPKLHVIFKLKYPEGRKVEEVGQFGTDILNITSNLKQFLSLPNNNNYKLEYDLKDSSAGVTDKSIDWQIAYKIINSSNPDIIKTKNGQIQAYGSQDYTKELNTKTNVTTYTSTGFLITDSSEPITMTANPNTNMNMKATVYINGTEVLESKQP